MRASRPRIAHITLQPHEGDARVLRSIAGLEKAGFECPVIAPGHGFELPEFSLAHKARLALTFGIGGRMGAGVARAAFFSFPHHRAALESLCAAKPDAIHAHDWDGLFVAARAAQILKVPFAYDAHELAAHMHMERPLWRATVAPLIASLEKAEAPKASFCIAVSDGHAECLRSLLGLKNDCIVVRNISETPPLSKIPQRHPDAPFLLHYHGAVAQGRGIEVAVEALERLSHRFQLRITGPWMQPAFEEKIHRLISEKGLKSRVEIASPVPHDRLVEHASEADIGLCMLADGSLHNEIALPNKVFDYLKAGLPVISSGSTQLDFAANSGAAVMLASCSISEFVCAVAGLDREQIDVMRRNALAVAKENLWKDDLAKLVAHWRKTTSFASQKTMVEHP